jgi:nitroimidazol reductase NimA-like FMN-containing flavoprotein (pyridoxamine 5'-phosphate oxidase superfamily)
MGHSTWRGKVGPMSDEERAAFLAGGMPMRLACLTPDGWPYITVCWHDWHDGSFWLVPRQRSRWAELLEQDGRLSFVVDDHETLEKVIGTGVAELVERPNVGGAWVEVATRMALRYLGPEGPKYLTPTLHQPRWLFRFEPTHVQTWQGVGWARRYWVEGTGGLTYDEAHSG